MPTISVVINVDTRSERNSDGGLFSGVVNTDFLTDNVYNKVKFFSGHEIELIVFIDKHNELPPESVEYLRGICDTLVIRKHSNEEKFNDWNYWSALALARGEYIAHFDQDVSAFTSSPDHVTNLLALLEQYDFVSYPSHWSPNAVDDKNYDYTWCSTRFFMCKRETLDFSEIKKCLQDYDYLYSTYTASVRNPWTEHILGLIAKHKGKGVYYPPIQMNDYLIFTWGNYERYLLMRLNEQTYEDVRNWVLSKGGIHYPNNVNA